MLRLIVIAIAMLTLAGCAVGSGGSDLGPMYVTLKATSAIVKDDAEKAARVREIATEIQRYASDTEFATVDLLVTKIRSEVPWDDLDLADTMLAEELVKTLRQYLVDRFGEGVLPPEYRVSVETIAGWVILAAS